MNALSVAFVVGLVAALTAADVSHLKQTQFGSNTINDDFVSIKFNDAGNTQKQSRYWWMNTETSPFRQTHNNHQNHQILSSHNTLHQTQNTLHETQQNYNQNPFLNVKTPQQYSNIYAHMATLSGSPSEVNSLMLDTTQANNIAQRYQPAPKIPCFGAAQVCAPKDACENGFISDKNLGLVLSQSNNCDSETESCCTIQTTRNDQSSNCADANSACVASKFCFNGFIDQSVEHKAVRSADGRCVAPEVCCRFSDRRRQATNFDNDFAAAGTSEVLTKEGYVVNVPSNQYLPSFPDPEIPDSSNNDPSRLKPDRPTTRPPAPQPTPPPRVVTTQPPRPVQTQPPYQPTQADYPSPTTQRPTQPPRVVTTTQINYQPQPDNQRPSIQRPNVVLEDQAISITPSACAAAMNCTPIEYCNAIGWISKTPVVLNDFQKQYRVPMTDCMMPNKELGKCCRDPDYTDPWPVGRTGQYVADELNAVFDSGAYKPDRKRAASAQVAVRVPAPNPAVAPTNQVVTRVAAPVQQRNVQQRVVAQQPRPYREVPVAPQIINAPVAQQQSCGVRNYNTQPRGIAPLGTGFGEFTWVAMVILESKKALLCGGNIIEKNVVVTSANCVYGQRHNDVLIKAGEWRLGSDEEPKPFQIVRVQKIIFHPKFQPNTLEHDIAILHLENDIKYDTHVGPICLDEIESIPSSNDDCVTTGWGKEVLKVHLGNALMQHTPVSPLSQNDCQSQLSNSRLRFTDSLVCGVTQQDACQVDIGSALACADRNGRYHLKGVYSSETSCNEPNQVVAYTKTDLQWIRDFLRSARPTY